MSGVPPVGVPDVAATEGVFAWLIERGQAENHSPTVWWIAGPSLVSREGEAWTQDASEATRFPSKADAQAVVDALFTHRSDVSARATEHGWFPSVPDVAATEES